MFISKWLLGLGTGGFLAAMTITPSEITATIVALVALVTAVGTMIVNIIAARATARKVDAVGVAVAEVDKETKVITGHVNSAASAANQKIDGLQSEIKWMRDALTEKKQEAALVAQSMSTARVAQTPAAPPVVADEAVDNLKKIDVNTKAIEKNTASTDAKVDDLKGGT